MRELVILGTASQVPTRNRNHNGYLLHWDGQGHQEGLLFDPGEGTQRQMLLAGTPSSRITRICLTHVHGDHCFGLPGVLSRMVLDGVGHPVHLHYPRSGEDVVRALVSLATPGLDLRLEPHSAPGPITEGIDVVPLLHRVETFGYRVCEPDGWTVDPARAEALGVRGPDTGHLMRRGRFGNVRISDIASVRPGQRFAIVMDTAMCDGAHELAEGAGMHARPWAKLRNTAPTCASPTIWTASRSRTVSFPPRPAAECAKRAGILPNRPALFAHSAGCDGLAVGRA